MGKYSVETYTNAFNFNTLEEATKKYHEEIEIADTYYNKLDDRDNNNIYLLEDDEVIDSFNISDFRNDKFATLLKLTVDNYAKWLRFETEPIFSPVDGIEHSDLDTVVGWAKDIHGKEYRVVWLVPRGMDDLDYFHGWEEPDYIKMF